MKTKEQTALFCYINHAALDKAFLADSGQEVTSQTEVLPLVTWPWRSGKSRLHLREGRLDDSPMDMGLTKNVQVTVRKLAPLGDPIELSLRGYALSLRKSEAEYILVEKEVTP